jgi:hypothetical protein
MITKKKLKKQTEPGKSGYCKKIPDQRTGTAATSFAERTK